MAATKRGRRVRRILTEFRGHWISSVRRRGVPSDREWEAQILRKGSTIVEQTVTGPSRYAVLQRAARVIDAMLGD